MPQGWINLNLESCSPPSRPREEGMVSIGIPAVMLTGLEGYPPGLRDLEKNSLNIIGLTEKLPVLEQGSNLRAIDRSGIRIERKCIMGLP